MQIKRAKENNQVQGVDYMNVMGTAQDNIQQDEEQGDVGETCLQLQGEEETSPAEDTPKKTETKNTVSTAAEPLHTVSKMVLPRSFWVVAAFCCALIAICAGWTIPSADRPVIIGDEIGYLGNAAMMTGVKWADIMSTISIYGFGYSFLLIPAFLLRLPMGIIYRYAICLNVLLLLLSFFLLFICLRRLFTSLTPTTMLLVATAATLYTNNMVMAQAAWSETTLYCVYCLIFWQVLRLLERPSVLRMVLLAISGGYIYMVHMRSIGVLIALVMTVLLFWAADRLGWKHVLAFVACFAIMLLLQNVIKAWLRSNAYTGTVASVNDYGKQGVKMIEAFTTWDGFVMLLRSICGKMYYVGVATLLMGFVSLKLLFTDFFKGIFDWLKSGFRNLNAQKLPSIFLALSFAGTFMTNAIAMMGGGRMDIPIYGRYMEFVFGPLIAIGLALLILGRVSIVQALSSSGLLLLLSAVAEDMLAQERLVDPDTFNFLCVAPLRHLIGVIGNCDYLAYIMALVSITMFLLIWAVQYTGNRHFVAAYGNRRRINSYKAMRLFMRTLLPALIATGCWLWSFCTGSQIVDTRALLAAEMKSTDALIDIVGTNPEKIIWIQDDGTGGTQSAIFLQMKLPYVEMQRMTQAEFQKADLNPDYLYVVSGDDNENIVAKERCVEVVHNRYFTLYAVPQSKWYNAFGEMPMLVSATNEAEITYGDAAVMTNKHGSGEDANKYRLKTNTLQNEDGTYSVVIEPNVTGGMATGIVAEGPSMELAPGKYRVDYVFTLDEKSNAAPLGEIDLQDVYGNVVSNIQLTAEDFTVGTPTQISMNVSTMLDQSISGVRFSWRSEGGVKMTLKKVSYTRTGDANEVVSADTPEMDSMERLLELDYEKHPLYVLPHESQMDRASIADLQSTFPDRDVLVASLSALRDQQGILLIPTDRSRQIVTLLGEYTIAEKIGNYTVMLPSDSTAYSEFVGHGGIPMSEGYNVQLRYYATNNTQAPGEIKATPAAGTYRLLISPAFSNLLTGHFGHIWLTVDDELLYTAELDRGTDRDAAFYMPFDLTLDGTEEVCVTINTDANVTLSDANITLRELGDMAFTYGDKIG